MAEPRVALVHDWLGNPGGGDRTVRSMHDIWPDAPLFTSTYVVERYPDFADIDVRTSWLNRVPGARHKHQLFTLPRAAVFRRLDLSDFDIVISSSSAEAKYVRTGPNTLHICFCHTPTRYYWSGYEYYREHPPFGVLSPLARVGLPLLVGPMRRIDRAAAQRVDHFVANSRTVQERIRRYYGRESTVINPPIEVDRFPLSTSRGEYYLVVGRQVAYKRLDLVVDAFNVLGRPLVVVGAGEEGAAEQARAGDNMRFVGRVSDDELSAYVAGAKALVFAPEEDFGMVPVEAMAAGRPVIVFGRGGAAETVIEGTTGTFFHEQTPAALVEAVERFETMTFDPVAIRQHALQFDAAIFRDAFRSFVDDAWGRYRAERAR